MRLCVAIASFVIVNGFVVPTGRLLRARTHEVSPTTLFDSADPYADLVSAYKKAKYTVENPPEEVTKAVEEATKTVKPAVEEVTKKVKPAVEEVAKSVVPVVEKVRPQYEPLPPGKAPSLLELATGRSADFNAADFDRVSNAKEKLGIFKSNLFGMKTGLSDVTVSNPAVSSKLTIIKENASGLKSTLDSSSDAVLKSLPTDQATLLMKNLAGGGDQIANIWTGFKFQEYGGWYVAALAIAGALVQRRAGKEDAAREFADQLTGVKSQASSAAEAATLAAKGAKLASAAASRARTSSSSAVLEATRSKVAEVENEILQKKVQKLENEAKAAKVAKAENAKLKKEITQLKKAASKSEKLLAEKKELQDQIATLKKGGGAAPKAKVAAKVAAKAKVKKAVKKAKVVADSPPPPDNEDLFFAANEEESSPPPPGPKGSKKATVAKSAPVDVSEGNPWGTLAPSSLKRKTVKDLTSYLSERGVDTKGDDGKALKKALLVEAVQNL